MSANLWVKVNFTSERELDGGDVELRTYHITGWEPSPYTRRKDLFAAMRKEYGGKVALMYVDRPGKEPAVVGRVYTKKNYREDRGAEPFTRSVWVTVAKRTDLKDKNGNAPPKGATRLP